MLQAAFYNLLCCFVLWERSKLLVRKTAHKMPPHLVLMKVEPFNIIPSSSMICKCNAEQSTVEPILLLLDWHPADQQSSISHEWLVNTCQLFIHGGCESVSAKTVIYPNFPANEL